MFSALQRVSARLAPRLNTTTGSIRAVSSSAPPPDDLLAYTKGLVQEDKDIKDKVNDKTLQRLTLAGMAQAEKSGRDPKIEIANEISDLDHRLNPHEWRKDYKYTGSKQHSFSEPFDWMYSSLTPTKSGV